MTKQELIDKVREANGAYNWLVLHDRISEAIAVIDRHLEDSPLPFLPAQSDAQLVDSAAGVLSGVVSQAFCAALSKDDAISLLRILAASDGVFSVCDGVELNDSTLRHAWNAAHADDKIYAGDYSVTFDI